MSLQLADLLTLEYGLYDVSGQQNGLHAVQKAMHATCQSSLTATS